MVQEYAKARAIGQDGSHRAGTCWSSAIRCSMKASSSSVSAVRSKSEYDARRYMVEQTVYYDWLYGLRRLYREGARPDIVVVMLGTGHWLSPTIRGDYSAQYLWSAADLPLVARDLGMHPTQATDLMFAGVSKFWGARAEMRNFVLGHLMPDLADLHERLERRRSASDGGCRHRRRCSRRGSRACAQVTDEHGSELVLLVPPLLNPDDGSIGH